MSDKFNEVKDNVVESVKDGLGKLGEKGEHLGEDLKKGFDNVVDKTKDIAEDVKDKAGEVTEDVKEKVKEGFDKLTGK